MIFIKTGWSVFGEFKASRHDLHSLNMMAFLEYDVVNSLWLIDFSENIQDGNVNIE